jgi:hypothetical protein
MGPVGVLLAVPVQDLNQLRASSGEPTGADTSGRGLGECRAGAA